MTYEQSKLQKEFESQLFWIRDMFNTRHTWDKEDYRAFYERDITVLIDYVEFLKTVKD